MVMILIFIFILGLVVGSFLNVVIYRLKKGGKFFFDRSRCPHCKKELKVLDLVPVFSFLFSRGHCRYCKKKISWQYPLVELGTAFIFFFTFLKLDLLKLNIPYIAVFGSFPLFVFFSFILSSLIIIFVYDLRNYLIPDFVLVPSILATFFIISLSYSIFKNFPISENILGALLFSGFFLFQYFVSSGRWIGGGDIKLGLLLGLILGWKLALVSLILAYIFGALIALILIALKKKTRKDILPFAPFLIISFVFSLFYGPLVLNWYLNFLFG